MTVLDNLDRIKQIKENIKQSITEKGVDMAGVPFYEYPNKIGDIQVGTPKIRVVDYAIKLTNSTFETVPEVFDFTGVVDYSEMFANNPNLKYINNPDFSNADNCDRCFADSPKLVFGKGIEINAPNATSANEMFINLQKDLENLEDIIDGDEMVSLSINMPNVTKADGMFYSVFSSLQKGGNFSINVYLPSAFSLKNLFTGSRIKYASVTGSKGGCNLDGAFAGCDGFNDLGINVGGIVYARGTFQNGYFGTTYISDLTNAIFDTSTFAYANFDHLDFGGQINNTDIVFTTTTMPVNDLIKIIQNNLGQTDTTHYIYLNSNLQSEISEELIASTSAKGWTIIFS